MANLPGRRLRVAIAACTRVWGGMRLLYRIVAVLVTLGGFGSLIYFLCGLVEEVPNDVHLNFERQCLRGSLSNLKRDEYFCAELSGDATVLRVCDEYVLSATVAEFPEKLAARYPGCLRFDEDDDALHMLFNPRAVCWTRIDGKKKYMCDGGDGGKGRVKAPDGALIGLGDNLPSCTDPQFSKEPTSSP